MKPLFVFYHLTFSFLILNSFTSMSKISRISIIGATLCLASYFTMTSPLGISWQVWASSIVLIHLFRWNKNNLNERRVFEYFEDEIYDSYFSEYDEKQFNLILQNSKWEEYSKLGTLKLLKDEVTLKWSDYSEWTFSYMNSILSVKENSIYFVIDINSIKEVDFEAYQKIMLLVQSSKSNSLVS